MSGPKASIERISSNKSAERKVDNPSCTNERQGEGKYYHVAERGSASDPEGVHRMVPGVNSASINITGSRCSENEYER